MGSPISSLVFRGGFATSSALMVVLAVACGGAKEPAKTSSSSSGDDPSSGISSSSGGGSSGGSGSGSGSGDTAAASSGAAATSSGGGGTTTTTQLGDGGDLQGAKLGGKMHSETSSVGPSAATNPKGGSAGEPGRTQRDITTIVGGRRDEARACYDKGLAAHPGIEGNLDVKWLIDPTGNVTEASVDTTKSQILEPGVGACVVDVIKKIKFAASAKGFETRAHYPFDFHPKTFTAKDAGK